MTPFLLAIGFATAPPLGGAMDHLSRLATCVHGAQIDRVCVARQIATTTPEERAALAGFLAFDRFYGQALPDADDDDRDEPPGM